MESGTDRACPTLIDSYGHEMARRPVAREYRWPDEQHGPWLVKLGFTAVSGRVECTSIDVSPVEDSTAEALTRSVLRSIPLGQLIDRAREEPADDMLALVRLKLPQRLGKLAQAGIGPLATERKSGPGRKPRPASHYQQVAMVYLADPHKPTTAVADHFHVAGSTAAKWVRRARTLGFIAETTPGKRSGAPPKEE